MYRECDTARCSVREGTGTDYKLSCRIALLRNAVAAVLRNACRAKYVAVDDQVSMLSSSDPGLLAYMAPGQQ